MRLEWLHARASLSRWWEEKTLLLVELDRVGRTFRYEECIWEGLAATTNWGAQPPKRLSRRGIKAYAAKRAAMFRSLAARAEQKYQNVTSVYPPLDIVM